MKKYKVNPYHDDELDNYINDLIKVTDSLHSAFEYCARNEDNTSMEALSLSCAMLNNVIDFFMEKQAKNDAEWEEMKGKFKIVKPE